jgi:UDP-N-acetylmuramate dehydrogenase
MNASTKHGQIKDTLESATILNAASGERFCLPAQDLDLGYRSSALQRMSSWVLIEATFSLAPSTQTKCASLAQEWLLERMQRVPRGAGSGCIFRNPSAEQTAGQLIDAAGCKGMHVGRARVSDEHANILVNEGVDNAGEVLSLIRCVKEQVRRVCDVQLQEEVAIVDP